MTKDNMYDYYVRTYKSYNVYKNNNLEFIDVIFYLDSLEYKIKDLNNNSSTIFALFDSIDTIETIDTNLLNNNHYSFNLLIPDAFLCSDFTNIIKQTIDTKLNVTNIVYDKEQILLESKNIGKKFGKDIERDYFQKTHILLEELRDELSNLITFKRDNNKYLPYSVSNLIDKIKYLSNELSLNIQYIDIQGSNFELRIFNKGIFKVTQNHKLSDEELKNLLELCIHLYS